MNHLRVGSVATLMLLCAACAIPTPLSAPARPSSSAVNVQAATPLPPSPSSSQESAVGSAGDPVVVQIDGSCPSNEPYALSLKSVSDSSTTIVGVANATGKHVVASPDSFASKTQVVYAEVAITVERQLLGPKLPDRINVYLPGGSIDGFKTTATSILESAWGSDGRFFGTIYPDTAVDGGYHMDVLPLDGNLISFAGVGCREPIGVALVADKSESTAFVMDDGEVTKRTGQYPKVDLASVEKLLG